jgi:undecaprenyl diphosphate synthase
VRPCDTTAGAVGERGCVACDRQGSQQIGVQDQRRRPTSVGGALVECSQGSHKEQVLLKRRFGLLDHQAIGRLEHHLAGGIGGIVIGQRFTEGIQRLDLRDHVECVSNGELQIDVGERFEPSAELRGRASHPLADCTYLAAAPAQHGDDAISFTELVRAKNHCFVTIGRHLDIVPDVAKLSRTAPRRTRDRKKDAKPESGVRPLQPPAAHSSGARPPQLSQDLLPAHVAIVMDGNGRWAKARNLPRTEGHARGEASLFDVIEGAIEIGVKYLSAYAFSTENWNRSPDEVRWLMGFNRDVIRRRRDQLDAMGVRVRWAGRSPRLWRSVINELEDAERRTVDNKVLTLQFCVNYGGRAEIVDATRRIAQLAAEGRLDPRKLTEERFRHFLDEPDIPDVDLFVRSSGEQRTSNFLLWQSAYAELVFLDRLWPDFDRRDLWRAIELYAQRDRRYGGAAPNAVTAT